MKISYQFVTTFFDFIQSRSDSITILFTVQHLTFLFLTRFSHGRFITKPKLRKLQSNFTCYTKSNR